MSLGLFSGILSGITGALGFGGTSAPSPKKQQAPFNDAATMFANLQANLNNLEAKMQLQGLQTTNAIETQAQATHNEILLVGGGLAVILVLVALMRR